MKIPARIVALGIVLCSQIAAAGPVLFTPDWQPLEFLFTRATRYVMAGTSVEITAKNSASVIYRPLARADWNSTRASWGWETIQSVPPTNLRVKGDDDRNIALYFVFLDIATAERIGRTADIKTLLTAKNARLLIYTFGGALPRDTVFQNPYLDGRGVTIVKRQATIGAFEESVDLAADYRRVFHSAPTALVGVALTSDSDDTDTLVVARVANLRLE
ncbi:MAG: DUF3047 domain-containing protein [Alphaproteobacteria bacterium]